MVEDEDYAMAGEGGEAGQPAAAARQPRWAPPAGPLPVSLPASLGLQPEGLARARDSLFEQTSRRSYQVRVRILRALVHAGWHLRSDIVTFKLSAHHKASQSLKWPAQDQLHMFCVACAESRSCCSRAGFW